eukprot:gene13751-16251_t
MEFYVELRMDKRFANALSGRPCFLQHSDPYIRAALTICFLYVVSLRAAQQSGRDLMQDPAIFKLYTLLEIGNNAALDGQMHIVKECVCLYSNHVRHLLGDTYSKRWEFLSPFWQQALKECIVDT